MHDHPKLTTDKKKLLDNEKSKVQAHNLSPSFIVPFLSILKYKAVLQAEINPIKNKVINNIFFSFFFRISINLDKTSLNNFSSSERWFS